MNRWYAYLNFSPFVFVTVLLVSESGIIFLLPPFPRKEQNTTGTFICPKALALEYGWESIPEGWTVKYIEDMANYLTFTAEEDGSSFGIVNNAGNNPDLQYSLDGGKTWTALAGGDSVLLVKHQRMRTEYDPDLRILFLQCQRQLLVLKKM